MRVTLFDWPLVNAFAAPGGQIILTRGLVQQATTPDEVAGVLAHELGHTLELHPEAGIIRAMGLSAAAQLALAGSSGTISNIGVVLTQLRYTRIAEREADTHALRILKGAGISHKGFGDFFERLEGKRTGEAAKDHIPGADVLSTHPQTADRVAMVRAQAAYPSTPALTSEEWRALRDACPAARPPQPAGPTPPRTATTPAPPTPSTTPAPGKPGTPTPPRSASNVPPPAPPPAATSPAPPAKADPQADREIADATKVLESNPRDVAALQKRALAYTRKGQSDAALGDYQKASDLKPDDPDLQNGRGAALQGLRRFEEALSAYEAALRLEPKHVNARNNRGNVNRELKRYDAALQDFDELIRVKPDFTHGLYNRGWVYYEMGRNEQAVRDFSSTVAQDKGYTAAYTSRGLAHEKMGAREKAIEDFRTAIATPPKFNNGAWAQTTARARLKALGVEAP